MAINYPWVPLPICDDLLDTSPHIRHVQHTRAPHVLIARDEEGFNYELDRALSSDVLFGVDVDDCVLLPWNPHVHQLVTVRLNGECLYFKYRGFRVGHDPSLTGTLGIIMSIDHSGRGGIEHFIDGQDRDVQAIDHAYNVFFGKVGDDWGLPLAQGGRLQDENYSAWEIEPYTGPPPAKDRCLAPCPELNCLFCVNHTGRHSHEGRWNQRDIAKGVYVQ